MKFFCVLLLVAVAKASVLKTAEDIPAPHLLRLVSLDPPGFKIEWNPVKSKDEADPVIGYKVKIWEQQSVKTYNYETVDGIPTLVQQSALNPFPLLSVPDWEPAEVIVPRRESIFPQIMYENIKKTGAFSFVQEGPGCILQELRRATVQRHEDQT
ncbi:hypothetical protein evm_015275 [Chilo suppressalis]|nr:hypothetical protein evm_015275 [Chilo suppressalis]